ncbi:septum formation inhibitor Maf [Psychroflexus gondwanensis]|uniref:septum formation inhibitor Maf n=1 Tax=Psychroflexus gondwanensis TaxID=251 RepID=UPI0011BDCD7C|nr:septum formation inhibitor Maf [Psychroflexus gondwanensis]TXE20837.1 septum formation inhibitor Maf [Psychroflexus gondwanensis]
MRTLPLLFLIFLVSCQTKAVDDNFEKRNLSTEFKSYWYDGKAELTSYDLEFYRYGEKRKGKAMLIFVTEDFLSEAQVKANSKSETTRSVMKLNSTKKFNTGIYPYSIMQSAFFPLGEQRPLLKLTSSVQEWCGQSYAQLNHRGDFKLRTHSYFEGEADSTFILKPVLTENQIWIQLRIAPKELRLGKQDILPDFSFLQLNHEKFKTYSASIEQKENDYLTTTLRYNQLGRVLKIYQEKSFPFEITKWEEMEIKGKDTLISKANKLQTLKTKYWQKNSDKYLHLRDSLSL